MSVPARIEERRPVSAAPQWTDEQVRVIKQLVCVGATDAELALFAEVCRKTGLDPFSRQIYGIKRKGQLTIQTSIDGFRLIAERTGKYGGQLGPQWCGPDAVWLDHWLAPEPPAGARVGVIRTDWKEPLWSFARFASYSANQNLWLTMPEVMIAKVAEANALRRAFPHELSSVYTDDEMDQAGPANAEPEPPAGGDERPAADAASAQPDRRRPLAKGETGGHPFGIAEATSGPEGPMTDAQIRALHGSAAMAAKRNGDGLDSEEIHALLHDVVVARFGVESVKDLTFRQAAGLIVRLQTADYEALIQLWDECRLALSEAAKESDLAGRGIPDAEDAPVAMAGGDDAAERARRRPDR